MCQGHNSNLLRVFVKWGFCSCSLNHQTVSSCLQSMIISEIVCKKKKKERERNFCSLHKLIKRIKLLKIKNRTTHAN